MTKSAARIPPLSPENFTAEQKELAGDWSHLVLSRVIVNHPGMYRTFIPVIAQVIPNSKLPPRDREIIVLRTLTLCDETYELHHHRTIAGSAGMSQEDIDAACAGKGDSLSAFDRTLIQAAEEIAEDKMVGDATWRELAQRYSQEQLMDLVYLGGAYVALAIVTKSLGIELESDQDLERIDALRDYT